MPFSVWSTRFPGHTAVLAACVVALAAACAGGAGAGARGGPLVDAREVAASLAVLAADSMEGRATGSAGAARAARFIAAELASYGVEPAFPAGGGGDSAWFQRVPLARREGGGLELLDSWARFDALPPELRVRAANVVGVVRGGDPLLSSEAVIVGAHFDHVGIGPAVGGDSIYNGADDDASGVVTVLEVARALARGPRPRRSVILLLTTGEEAGLLGTRWYIGAPATPLERTVADLQVEMVGRPDPLAGGAGRAWLTGYERSTLGAALAAAGVPIISDPRPQQRFFERSDNIAFACQGIPAHTLSSFGLHADYHGPDDEVERVDTAHLAAVIEAAIEAVRVLANGDAPRWVEGGDPRSSGGVCG